MKSKRSGKSEQMKATRTCCKKSTKAKTSTKKIVLKSSAEAIFSCQFERKKDVRCQKDFVLWVKNMTELFPLHIGDTVWPLNDWIEQFVNKGFDDGGLVESTYYLLYTNDVETEMYKSLLKKALSHARARDFPEQAIKLRRKLFEIEYNARMTDGDEQVLKKNLGAVEKFPLKNIDALIDELRHHWSELFSQETASRYPKIDKTETSQSRLMGIVSLWKKLTPYEREFIFEHIIVTYTVHFEDLFDILAHIPDACEAALKKCSENIDSLRSLSQRKDFGREFILADLYVRLSGKKPSHNSTGPFARFVRAVLQTRITPGESATNESLHRALNAYKNKSVDIAIDRTSFPDFDCIRLLRKQ